jgi:pilus assembly protein CpaB
MKAARLVVLGVAIAAGGVAAMLAGRSRPPEAPPPVAQMPALETVDVLVAKTDLQRGQLIEAAQIGWQPWPKAAANANFITKAARPNAATQFVHAIVRVPIVAGQPVYDPMVVFAKGSGFMAAILPKGMRAIAMDVSPDSAAGGFILPEDHVDVLLTRHDKAAEKVSGGVEKIVSDTILRNIRVLAVDQAVEEKAGQKVAVAKTVTLQVAPAQAEVLALARMQGTLSLSLRSLTDSPNAGPEGEAERTEVSAAINTVRFGVSTMTTVAR